MQNPGQNSGQNSDQRPRQNSSQGISQGQGQAEKSILAPATRIVGQLGCQGDLLVEGQLEGGPLYVGGCLTVAESAKVQCEDAEVGEALVAGLFQGTLRARDVVRIHHSGRVIGDILAPRVVFVSSAERPAPPRPEKQPASQAAPGSAPAGSPAGATVVPPPAAPTAPAAAARPQAARPATPSPVPAAPRVPVQAPPAPVSQKAPAQAPAAPPAARAIPTLPTIGQRAMERKA